MPLYGNVAPSPYGYGARANTAPNPLLQFAGQTPTGTAGVPAAGNPFMQDAAPTQGPSATTGVPPTPNWPYNTGVNNPSTPTQVVPGNMSQPGAGGMFGSAVGTVSGPNWLYNPQDAVVRAMRQAGLNPASANPMIRSILNNADNLMYTTMARQILPSSPTGDPATAQSHITNLADNDYMLTALTDMVQRASRGERVLGGFQPNQLQVINDLAQQANTGTSDPGVAVMGDYLFDPGHATNLATSLLYSGMHPTFQKSMSAPFINLNDYYAQLLETGQAGTRNIIDILLGTNGGQYPTPAPFTPGSWRL